MSILAKIFGGREAFASATIEKELADVGRQLDGAKARLAKVTDKLADPSMMSAEDHSAADTESRELTLAIVRYGKQIEKLGDALTKAKASEALDDLKGRAMELRQRLDRDIPKALDDYEKHAAGVAVAVQRYEATRLAIEQINSELHTAGLESIEAPEHRYRRVAGIATPARYETRTVWVRERIGTDGRKFEETAMVFGRDAAGDLVPSEGGYQPVKRRVWISPEHRGQDTWLPSLAHAVRLPPSRAGHEAHWPRSTN